MVTEERSVYELKVTLQEIRPPIWRQFQVLSDITFQELHLVLQVVMGWWNYHLHQFGVGGITITDTETLLEGYDWLEGIPEETTRLDAIVTKRGQRFSYEYDFGDSWGHELALVKILPLDPGARYPRCLAGARACPPEDVGGSGGYGYYLEAMSDPRHREHESYLAWRGEYDPEAFDVDEINRQLRQGIRWDDELVLAPLVSTQTFTRPAQWFWGSIPEDIQTRLLGDVYCKQCGAETAIVDFRGSIKQGDLVLQGLCARCGSPVTRVIEGE